MDTLWSYGKDILEAGRSLDTYQGLFAFLVAIVTCFAAILKRKVFVIHSDKPPGPPLRFSLKAILKGWFSVIIWTILLFLCGILIVVKIAEMRISDQFTEIRGNELLMNIDSPSKDTSDSYRNENQSISSKYSSQSTLKSSNDKSSDTTSPSTERRQAKTVEVDKILANEQFQVILLVLLGCVYARAAYIASRSARSTSLMNLAHGLLSVAGFWIVLGLFMNAHFPEISEGGRDMNFAYEWEWVSLAVGCIVGAIMGSEDP